MKSIECTKELKMDEMSIQKPMMKKASYWGRHAPIYLLKDLN